MIRVDRRQTQLNDDFAAVDLEQMQLAGRYTDWVAQQVQSHCGRRILEVGAGIGNITSRLLQHSEYVCALEPNPTCFENLRRSFDPVPRFECRPWRIEDCDREFIAQRQIDTVVCVNVLEHIDDDLEALRQLRALLERPVGTLVLLVPAVPAVYGAIDVALGHYRRYSRAALRSLLVEAGFSVQSLRYSNAIGLIGWLFNARILRRVQQNDTQIKLFDTLVVPWYSRLERLIAPPIGMSLVAVARVPR